MVFWLIFFYALYKVLSFLWDFVRFKNIKPGSVVLITGGCQGLGKDLAIKYASQKCCIAIWDISTELFDIVKHEIQQVGGSVFICKCDISSDDDVDRAAKETLNHFGAVDIVVNNAAISNNRYFEEISMGNFKKIYDINVLGQVRVAKKFVDCASQFVIITSVLSKVPAEKASDYCGTKAAVDLIFRSWRFELKRKNSQIKITMIYPAHMKTRMFEGYLAKNAPFIPSLNTKDVAEEIYNAVCLKKEELYLPFIFVHVANIGNIFPSKIRDLLMMWISKGALDNVSPRV
ncbi:hypothetical protein SteCoe_33647 [Stentor coeruleus]|uniref:Uncharacterized protein n=1 Tax=Stentor coeruleus TaxID=5963 RepID=A0A1R2AWA5_9CILI|nr:hypothetical protein SteCoe_33647 [Stentor coeruleus]